MVPVAAPSTTLRRYSATGGASTGAASSAVSIPLPLPCKTSPGVAGGSQQHSAGPQETSWAQLARTGDGSGQRWLCPSCVGLDSCFLACFLGLAVPKGELVSWRDVVLPVQREAGGMHLQKQST